MSRLLTQEEVDALLASFDAAAPPPALSGEAPFDLRAPLLLAGERLALVQAACEKLADLLAEALTIVLVAEKPIHGEFTGLVQQPASTVLGTMAQGEPVGLLLDEHGEPVGGIALQAELALAIVDRLQGGEGLTAAAPRALSPVEVRLLESAIERLSRYLDRRSALAPVKAGGMDLDSIFGRLAQRGGMLAVAAFRLTTEGGDVLCRLLMTPALTTRLVAEPPEHQDAHVPVELLEALRKVPVKVHPVITGATLRVTDLRRMKPGNVLQLEVREQDPIGLRFNGALLARGHLKRSGHDRMFEITHLTSTRSGT